MVNTPPKVTFGESFITLTLFLFVYKKMFAAQIVLGKALHVGLAGSSALNARLVSPTYLGFLGSLGYMNKIKVGSQSWQCKHLR